MDSPFDADGDGFFDGANPGCAATYPPERLDCHDGNADANPEGFELTCNGIDDDCDEETEDSEDEVCDDGVDNDCDTRIDEGCGTDTGGGGGVYSFSPPVTYQCAYGLAVNMNFNGLVVQDTGSQLIISPSPGANQPGTMVGPSGTNFTVTNVLQGACTETYTLDGTFTSATQIDGTLTMSFSEVGGNCLDCVGASWNISATSN
ncbi:MAG: hypothetical protein KC912_06995 [Proteobacteria bacterium]|nr:hypothetical protein [Pseudomonadota bacterium]